MKSIITFIIPVRHQDNSKDWSRLKLNLTQTVKSISAQTNPNWRAIIVANNGADLPELPEKFKVCHVDFPPNKYYLKDGIDMDLFHDSVRLDKGKRILHGMLNADETTYFMIVDDDDLISNNLVQFADEHTTENGWRVDEGYVWEDNGRLLFKHNDFSNYCGTSLIIRKDLYDLPSSLFLATEDYIKTILGSHVKISGILASQGSPLEKLPFRGAIYRVGYSGSHSSSPKIFKMFFTKKYLLRPHKMIIDLFKIRLVNSKIKQEFFGM